MKSAIKILLMTVLTVLLVLEAAEAGRSIISAFADSSSRKPLALERYTGVAYLEPVQCTGSVLTGGLYVITAAHCLNEGGVKIPAGTAVTATFKVPSGQVTIPVSNYYIHPGWTGYESEVGNDIAILKLKRIAPPSVEQYEINRNKNEVGQLFTKVGYGYIGLGNKGQNENSNSEAKRYAGQNRYDGLGDIFKSSTESDMSELVLGSQLIFDFDDGTAEHDSLGRHFPKLADRGLGKNEIATASGDSGGPSFVDGKIAGISSWGYSDRGFFKTNIGDIDKIDDNGSFGEISGDTRVSFYASWIDKVTGGR
ncbi:MAG: trypsin-like serine protease [Microcoleus sp. PH2017_22_RUC_O_B]|uniref:trypsin-like serine protease n=2 Tax=unclassified Microcoleus TaxID=2642155 RepID=UPI001D39D11C|nr:trypsin-like serine protease [Microcoleus sp. PH2017_22_RUC_O_B]MCC3531535.1 trypsin-like serine protease [Microcoleus sp. PH2017_21_RUC_O_A]MCC3543869.1 trypsin-like serine protease [Microcoleus sp. PH2017_22_RUC_O_B]